LSTAVAFWNATREGCSERTAGACTVRACAAPTDGARAPSAGDVTLGIDGAATPLSLSPDGSGRYANPARPTPMWSEGTQVRFAAAGAEVPAFAVTLAAPRPLRVVSPDFASAPAVLDRAAAFHARWEPGDGEVRVAVRQEAAPTGTAFDAGVAVDCFFDRASGEGEIPPAALAGLTPGDANVMVYGVRRTRIGTPYDILVLVNTAGVFQRASVR
jgi:hypothetical protein